MKSLGEDNVVQVVTDVAANYIVDGQMLMAKRKRIFWISCGAHYVDLMLENYEKIPIDETIPKGKRK